MDGLYTTSYLWVEHKLGDARATECFNEGVSWHLHKGWKSILEIVLNEVEECMPFQFEEPKKGGVYADTWEIPESYHRVALDERNKHAMLGIVGGIARAFMHTDTRLNAKVEDIDERGWGRLIAWCTHSHGLNANQAERRRARTRAAAGLGRRRGGRGPGPSRRLMEELDEEVDGP